MSHHSYNQYNSYKQEPILVLPNKTDEQRKQNHELLSNRGIFTTLLEAQRVKGWPTTNCDNKPLYEVSYLKFFAPERPVIE